MRERLQHPPHATAVADTPETTKPSQADVNDVLNTHVSRWEHSLGRGVVRSAIIDAMHEADGTADQQRESLRRFLSAVPSIRPSEQKSPITEIREKVDTLPAEPAGVLMDAMDGTFVKRALFDHDEDLAAEYSRSHENPVGKRLNMKRDGEYIVDDETVRNFVEWYSSRTQEKQAALEKDEAELKARYKQKIEKAVEDGWLPQAALASLGNIDSTDLSVDDMFTTDIDDTHGWYRTKMTDNPAERPVIALSPNQLGDEREHLLDHELSHALSTDATSELSRHQLLQRIFGAQGATVINEALTEHLAESLHDGDFDSIDPDERILSSTYYREYRSLLNVLANGGKQKIDIRDFYASLYFSHNTEDNLAPVFDLLEKLDAAFPGVDVRHELMDLEEDTSLDPLIKKLLAASSSESVPEKKPTRLSLLSRLNGRLVTSKVISAALSNGGLLR